MKINVLKLSAFGPFVKEIEIDFDKFNKGLFLISGDTGSGKTMLFDGISFALFGKTSSNVRESKTLRSDFAKTEETYVYVKFSHKGLNYSIKRVPQHSRLKLRGEGFTNVSESIELILPNNKVITRVSEANQFIEDIIGLDYNQFKQIVLLAQGEFRQLLLASSEERSNIFRKIFDTFKYEQFENKLRNLKRDLSRELAIKKTQIKQVLTEIDKDASVYNLPDFLKLLDDKIKVKSTEISKLNTSKDSLEKSIKNQEKVINDNNSLINLYKQLEDLNNKLLKLENNKEDFNIIEKKLKRYKIVSQEVFEIKDQQIENKANLKEVDLELNKLDKLQKTINLSLLENKSKLKLHKKAEDDYQKKTVLITTLNDSLPLYSKFETDSKQLTTLESKIKTLKKQIEQISFEILNNENKQIEYSEKLKQIAIDKVEVEKISNKLKDLNNNIEKANEKAKLLKNIDRVSLTILDLQRKYNYSKNTYKAINEYYQHSYNLFLDQQAGVLAKDLKAGEMCPVCGSIHHPQLASISEDVDKNHLDYLKEALDLANDDFNKFSLKLQTKNNELNNFNNDLKKYDFNFDLDQLMKSKKELEIILVKLDQSIKTEESINLKLEKNISKNNELKIKNNANEEILKKLESDYATLIGSLNQQKESLTFKNIDDVKVEIKKLEEKVLNYNNQLNKLQKALESDNKKLITYTTSLEHYNKNQKELLLKQSSINLALETKFKQLNLSEIELKALRDYKSIVENEKVKLDAYNLEVKRAEIEIATLNKQVLNKEVLDDKTLKSNLDKSNIELKELEETLIALQIKLNTYKKSESSLKNLNKEYEKLNLEYSEISNLADSATGDLVGKYRLSFERYVQATYFNQIINQANNRLNVMSQGRYLLFRKEDGDNKRSKVGLDLEVLDNHTGIVRDVKTLSGGESFKASLALALGLSDVIQSSHGGVEIEMLFVDEGFGTLDATSLEQAITTLITLSGSNQLIGIISHVSELKNQIEQKINVIKSPNGSSIKI